MRRDLAGTVIIFDLDGTLVDTAGDLAAAMNHVLAGEGRAVLPLARVRHLIGQGAEAMLARGFAETGGAPRAADMEVNVRTFLDHYTANIATLSRPFPGAIEAIGELRAIGAACAVCTNKRETLSRALLAALRINSHFDAIVGGDTGPAPKPDPAPVRLCIERTRTERAIFVGDSDTDIKAAKAAGIPCLLATFGYGPALLRAEAAASFDAYAALPDLIRRVQA
jgi:phosphoglycolate phosphatase